jgi:hypothetical protein
VALPVAGGRGRGLPDLDQGRQRKYGTVSIDGDQAKSVHQWMVDWYLEWQDGHRLEEGWSLDHLCHDGQNMRRGSPFHLERVSDVENTKRRAMRRRGEDVTPRIKLEHVPGGDLRALRCRCDYERVEAEEAKRRAASEPKLRLLERVG